MRCHLSSNISNTTAASVLLSLLSKSSITRLFVQNTENGLKCMHPTKHTRVSESECRTILACVRASELSLDRACLVSLVEEGMFRCICGVRAQIR